MFWTRICCFHSHFKHNFHFKSLKSLATKNSVHYFIPAYVNAHTYVTSQFSLDVNEEPKGSELWYFSISKLIVSSWIRQDTLAPTQVTCAMMNCANCSIIWDKKPSMLNEPWIMMSFTELGMGIMWLLGDSRVWSSLWYSQLKSQYTTLKWTQINKFLCSYLLIPYFSVPVFHVQCLCLFLWCC